MGLTTAETVRAVLFLQGLYAVLAVLLGLYLRRARPGRDRVRTAVVRLAVFYAVVHVTLACLVAGGWVLRVAAALLALAAVGELLGIAGPAGTRTARVLRVVARVAAVALVLALPTTAGAGLAYAAAVLGVALAVPVVLADPRGAHRDLPDALFAVAVAGGLPYLLVRLAEHDRRAAVAVLLAAVLTDAFSEACGRFLGRHPWIRSLSPNKTLEGSVGGVLLATAATVAVDRWVVAYPGPAVPVALLLCCAAHVGDLAFSALKRSAGTKDFAGTLPGHGGVLDRFDSVLYAATAMTLVVVLT